MKTDWSRPGQTSTFTCRINIKNLALSRPTTLLYDLFMVTQSNGLYPVPVRVKNYRGESNTELTNTFSKEPSSSDQFFRRFTWIDTETGIINGKLT